MLKKPSWRRHNNVNHPIEGAPLDAVVLAADDERAAQLAGVGEGLEDCEDLNAQLACRREDDGAGAFRFGGSGGGGTSDL